MPKVKKKSLEANRYEEVILSPPNYSRIKAFYTWERTLSKKERLILDWYKGGEGTLKDLSKRSRIPLKTLYNLKLGMAKSYSKVLDKTE